MRAELVREDGVVVAQYRLDVSPRPDKLGRDIFGQMLDELWAFDPRLVLGSEPARMRRQARAKQMARREDSQAEVLVCSFDFVLIR